MKIVIILKKIQVTMNTFALPFLNHFSLQVNWKKMCGNESHEKETKHTYASAANLLHIRIGNINWCKWGYCKSEAKEIDCFCYREMDAMLFALVKIPEYKGSILQSSFYRHFCPIISHTCQPYLLSRWVLSVRGVAKRNENHGGI